MDIKHKQIMYLIENNLLEDENRFPRTYDEMNNCPKCNDPYEYTICYEKDCGFDWIPQISWEYKNA